MKALGHDALMHKKFLKTSYLLFAVFLLSGCVSKYYTDYFSFLSYDGRQEVVEVEEVKEPETITLGEATVPLDIIDEKTNDVSLLKATQYNFGPSITLYPLDGDIVPNAPVLEKSSKYSSSVPTRDPSVTIYSLDNTVPYNTLNQSAQTDQYNFTSPFDGPGGLLPTPLRKPGTISPAEPRTLTGY